MLIVFYILCCVTILVTTPEFNVTSLWTQFVLSIIITISTLNIQEIYLNLGPAFGNAYANSETQQTDGAADGPQTDLKIFVIDGASVKPTRLAMVLKFCEGSSSMMRFTSFTLSSFSQALKFWFSTLLRYCEKRRLLRHICSATLLTVSPHAPTNASK